MLYTVSQTGNISRPLFNIAQAAKLLNVSQRSVRRFIQRREINYIRVGNLYRFRFEALALFLEQREVKAKK